MSEEGKASFSNHPEFVLILFYSVLAANGERGLFGISFVLLSMIVRQVMIWFASGGWLSSHGRRRRMKALMERECPRVDIEGVWLFWTPGLTSCLNRLWNAAIFGLSASHQAIRENKRSPQWRHLAYSAMIRDTREEAETAYPCFDNPPLRSKRPYQFLLFHETRLHPSAR